ncbi:MAG: ABC transporter permease, partial [Candidatus Kapaibacterium sp.]
IEGILSITFLMQVLRMFTPYYLGASAANFSERGGVINIAIEGFMIISAFSYASITIFTENPYAGLVGAVAIGILFSFLYSLFTIKLKINQIVIGVGFNLLMAGLAKFLMLLFYQSSSNTPAFPHVPRLPFLSSIPLIGDLTGDSIIMFALMLVILSQIVIYKTKFGLRLRSVGENPEAAETLGIKVRIYKMWGTIICGFLASLGGIWLASNQSSFSDGMIAGRGYIAIAAMIIGKWKPVNIFFACLMFAFFESLEIVLQISGSGIPSQLIQMLPYLITILVLIGFVGKTKPPAADGVPY